MMNGEQEKKTIKKRKRKIAILLIIGFMAIEFPGVLLIQDRVEPFILGLPFLYGYVLCGWLYLCGVFLYAYYTGWGKKPLFNKVNKKKKLSN